MIVEYDCIVCGLHCRKTRSVGNMLVPPRFCSQKCSGVFKTQNKKGTTSNFHGTCKTCGKNFSTYRSPSQPTPKFCSLTCLGGAQKGENNPAFNGGEYDCDGYRILFMPNHPNKSAKNMIYEHRFIMECKLGRYLTDVEVVHHIDEDRKNNDPVNLRLFANQSDHMKHHAKLRNKK